MGRNWLLDTQSDIASSDGAHSEQRSDVTSDDGHDGPDTSDTSSTDSPVQQTKNCNAHSEPSSLCEQCGLLVADLPAHSTCCEPALLLRFEHAISLTTPSPTTSTPTPSTTESTTLAAHTGSIPTNAAWECVETTADVSTLEAQPGGLCAVCCQYVNRDAWALHMQTCSSSSQTCEQCGVQLAVADVALHSLTLCPERFVRCDFCTMELPAAWLVQHVLESHGFPTHALPSHADDLTRCGYCDMAVKASHAREHRLGCVRRPVSCHVCGLHTTAVALAEHTCPETLNKAQPGETLVSCRACDEPYTDEHKQVCLQRQAVCAECQQCVLVTQQHAHTADCSHTVEEVVCGHCSRVLRGLDYDAHQHVCGSRPLPCAYCSQSIEAKDLLQHQRFCPLRTVTCFCCEEPVLSKDMAPHLMACPRRVVVCDSCGFICVHSQMQAHVARDVCASMSSVTLCPHCNASFAVLEWLRHRHVCGQRRVACDTCSHSVPLCDLQDHKQNKCLNRQIECSRCLVYRCAVVDLPAHQAVCAPSQQVIVIDDSDEQLRVSSSSSSGPFIFEDCEDEDLVYNNQKRCPSCKQSIPLRFFDAHVVQLCPQRPWRCPLCSHTTTAVLADAHQSTCEGMIEGSIEFQDLKHSESSSVSDVRQRCRYCREPVSLASFAGHSATCGLRPVACVACGDVMASQRVGQHEALFCRRRLEACKQCHESVKVCDLATHLATACSGRLVPCSLCQGLVPVATLDTHQASGCRVEDVPCDLCQALMPPLLVRRHHRRCPGGTCRRCGHVVPSGEGRSHRAQCGSAAAHGSGVKVKAKAQECGGEAHARESYPCVTCGQPLPADSESVHHCPASTLVRSGRTAPCLACVATHPATRPPPESTTDTRERGPPLSPTAPATAGAQARVLPHTCGRAAMATCQCDVCGAHVDKAVFAAHICPPPPTQTCKLCGATVSLNEVDIHRKDKCPKRKMVCKHCRARLLADEIADHRRHCTSRPLPCRVCGVLLPQPSLESHQATCGSGIPQHSAHLPSSSPPTHTRPAPCARCGLDIVDREQCECGGVWARCDVCGTEVRVGEWRSHVGTSDGACHAPAAAPPMELTLAALATPAAIASTSACEHCQQLIKTHKLDKHVRRCRKIMAARKALACMHVKIGVVVEGVTRRVLGRTANDVRTQHYVRVKRVVAESSGDEGGVRPLDIVLDVDGHSVLTTAHFSDAIATLTVGSSVEMNLLRDGHKICAALLVGAAECSLSDLRRVVVLAAQRA